MKIILLIQVKKILDFKYKFSTFNSSDFYDLSKTLKFDLKKFS